MKPRLLIPALLVLTLAACAADTAGESAAPAADTAAGETEAVYGDEAPVAIAPEPADGHAHGEGAHGHDDHAHDDHAHDDKAHDHGDGSEPHAH